MENREIDRRLDFKKENLALMIFLGILFLSVGCMFFIPGLFFLKKLIQSIFINKQPIDFIFVLLTTFTLSIGTILLLLAYKLARRNMVDQFLSFPVLTFASLFFISIATFAVILGLVLHRMPLDRTLGNTIGCGYTLGGLGLWCAFKRKTAPNQKDAPDPIDVR